MALFSGTQESYYSGDDLGNYQYISLKDLINNFMIGYVGEDKVITKLKRTQISFYAQRAIQELSFDTLRSIKAYELELPASATIQLPHDYVNYVKVTWVDSNGLERLIHPVKTTSNPTAILKDNDGNWLYDNNGEIMSPENSETWSSFSDSSSNTEEDDSAEYPEITAEGARFGIDPEHSQGNGWFYIDQNAGKIHFSSNITEKRIIIKYISDGLGTEEEIKVHKFAEEAVYKDIAYAVLSTRANVPEYIINRYKRERFATKRLAKLRLSNIKTEEITQVLRGKSKWIKH